MWTQAFLLIGVGAAGATTLLALVAIIRRNERWLRRALRRAILSNEAGADGQ